MKGIISISSFRNIGYKKKRKKTKRKPVSKTRKNTLKKTEHFHRHKHRIPSIILSKVDDKEIIYGEMALKKQLPSFLHRHTEDYDIITLHPRKEARESERALDKMMGGNFFFIKPALHPDTWKVVAYANKQGYVDYTKPKKHIPFDVIGGKRYVKLSHVKQTIRRTLRDPESKYRHDKDRDALQRILIYEKLKRGY